MAVDAVYLFDEKRQIRSVIVQDVYELIHDEATYELDAEINAEYRAKPGEFLGFFGVEGFLLFEIDSAEIDDRRGVLVITATDAAVAELAHTIVPEIRLTEADARTAAEAALAGSGWTIGRMTESERTADLNMYYETRWKALREIAVQWQTRVTARYLFDGTKIIGKTVDVTDRENVYRGRLLEGATGTSAIYVTYSTAPVTRMYGTGKPIGEEDPPTCVTFADVEWSRENGDPADKPKGQTYIEDADAVALYGEGREAVHSDKNITDPAELLEETRQALQKAREPKVSGTATAADMEHIPGYEHQIVRMYDRVWVRTRRGVDISAVVINVKRNYLRRGLTKIMVGEETDDSDLIKKIAKMSADTKGLKSSKDSFSNRYVLTRQLIQFNADTIQMNARLIEANAEVIHLTASNLKDFEEGTDDRLTSAELTLYGDGETAGGGLVARVDGNEASITVHASEIETLAEVKADKVDLGKYATVEKLESEIANLELTIGDSITVRTLNVTAATSTDSLYVSTNASIAGSLTIGGTKLKLISKNYVKYLNTTVRHVLSPAGISVDIKEVRDYAEGTINYLGYE